MRRLVTVLSACLWACGDNHPSFPDAMSVGFQPAPHAPMPSVLKHKGTVLSHVQLVTITFDNDAAGQEVQKFGRTIFGSDWYKEVIAEYDVVDGSQVQALTIGPAPMSITRAEIEARVKQLIADDSTLQPPMAGNQLLYMVYIPSSVSRGAGLENITGGYHQMSRLNGASFPIAVVLDDANDVETTISTAAQQLINTVTNPYNDGYYADPLMSDPWSLVHGEIADLCSNEAPVTTDGFRLPRIYSGMAAKAGRSPCKPSSDDVWTNVSAVPSQIQMVARGTSVTFTLTGWSTQEMKSDWELQTKVADFSKLSKDDMQPSLSDDRINNSTSVTLTLHAPADAASGVAGGVYVLSVVGTNAHPWAVGFIVQ